MARRRVRICAFCGREGIVLSMGGIGGAVYRCPHCDYTGPIVLEREREADTPQEAGAYSIRTARLNSTLNLAGLLFGFAFMTVGLLVIFWPFPLARFPPPGKQFFVDSGIAIVAIGAMLVAVSGLFWLAEHPRRPKKYLVA